MNRNIVRSTVCVLASLLFSLPLFAQQSGKNEQAGRAQAELMNQVLKSFQDAHWDSFRSGQTALAADYLESVKAEEPSKHWIGVYCEPVESVEVQLNEDAGVVKLIGGLKISKLIDDSPAKKAGLLEGDIVIKANGKQMIGNTDLTSIIKSQGASEIKVALVRNNELVLKSITPELRPKLQSVEKAARNSTLSNLAWVYHPGYMIPQGYSATITYEPQKAPKFMIRKGDEVWTVEGDHSKLPAEVRAFARAAAPTRPTWWTNKVNFNQNPGGQWPIVVAWDQTPPVGARLSEVRKQIAELTKVVNEIRNEVEKGK